MRTSPANSIRACRRIPACEKKRAGHKRAAFTCQPRNRCIVCNPGGVHVRPFLTHTLTKQSAHLNPRGFLAANTFHLAGEYTYRRSRVGDSPPRRRKRRGYLLMPRREGKRRTPVGVTPGMRSYCAGLVRLNGSLCQENMDGAAPHPAQIRNPLMGEVSTGTAFDEKSAHRCSRLLDRAEPFRAGDDVRDSCVRTMDAISVDACPGPPSRRRIGQAPWNTHSAPPPSVTSNSGSFEVLTLRLVHVGHRA
jgi:hypothetical protein